MKLNLGCGQTPMDDFVNVDWIAGPGVDQVVDLRGLWPWPEGSVDELVASHLIEHIDDPLHFMAEAWRVAEPGAQFTLACPYGSSDDADEDPTHVRRMFLNSWGYFGQPIYWRGNTEYEGDWRVVLVELRIPPKVWTQCQSPAGDHGPALTRLMHRVSYERNIVQEMVALLEAVKPARPRDQELMGPIPIQLQVLQAEGPQHIGTLTLGG